MVTYSSMRSPGGTVAVTVRSIQGLLHVYQKKLSGLFLTLVRGARLTGGGSGSVQTRYVEVQHNRLPITQS